MRIRMATSRLASLTIKSQGEQSTSIQTSSFQRHSHCSLVGNSVDLTKPNAFGPKLVMQSATVEKDRPFCCCPCGESSVYTLSFPHTLTTVRWVDAVKVPTPMDPAVGTGDAKWSTPVVMTGDFKVKKVTPPYLPTAVTSAGCVAQSSSSPHTGLLLAMSLRFPTGDGLVWLQFLGVQGCRRPRVPCEIMRLLPRVHRFHISPNSTARCV